MKLSEYKLTKKHGRIVMPGLTRHPASLNTVKQRNPEPPAPASARGDDVPFFLMKLSRHILRRAVRALMVYNFLDAR